MKKIILLLVLILLMQTVHATTYQQTFNSSSDNIMSGPAGAQFKVDALKYEPYPVNPGDYFDLWIKVENIGNDDALNAKFELVPAYPFSSTDNLVREYGRIAGNHGQENEENQVVLRYRVKVADDAPEGSSDLEFKTSNGGFESTQISKKLQIGIGKTKTDFDVVMQDSTAQGTSIAISNIGENPATAVTVRVKPQDGFSIKGPESSIIGNLDKGDFTTTTFQIIPKGNSKELTVEIDYTDISGVRNVIEKKVPVDIIPQNSNNGNNGRSNTKSSSSLLSSLIYIVIGIVISLIGFLIWGKTKRRLI